VAEEEIRLKGGSIRREKHGPVDYPLCHLVGVKKKDYLAVAASGLCAFPFRSEDLEKMINDNSLSPRERAEKSLDLLPGSVRSDDLGSDDYRRALWQIDLAGMLEELEGAER
jgi:CO/xanthine dehydrogenase FAD-binding subunit